MTPPSVAFYHSNTTCWILIGPDPVTGQPVKDDRLFMDPKSAVEALGKILVPGWSVLWCFEGPISAEPSHAQ